MPPDPLLWDPTVTRPGPAPSSPDAWLQEDVSRSPGSSPSRPVRPDAPSPPRSSARLAGALRHSPPARCAGPWNTWVGGSPHLSPPRGAPSPRPPPRTFAFSATVSPGRCPPPRSPPRPAGAPHPVLCGRWVQQQREEVYEKITQHMWLKTVIERLQVMVPPPGWGVLVGGSEGGSQPDTSRIFVALGYGFFAELTLTEALRFVERKTKLLIELSESLAKDSAKIKANIRMVLEGLRELQGFQDLPEDPRRDLAL
uniref:Ubiquitously expressed prefoldin like chaperone n=1 Tax=Chelonoidis abingdonii TaxID=106734 RepID=A0A8C0J4S1_CHEAB